ncbi:MAG: magnesium transporter [Bacteroidia bacterium]|nr:magnesium transporter [Bacteroidia bacterium]MCZ2278139.1 magnesium transporter [Bacteroidia bacterium]
MEHTLQKEEFIQLLSYGNRDPVKEHTENMLTSELAEIVSEIPEDQQVFAFRCMSRDKAARVFELIELEIQKRLLDVLPHRQVALLLNDIAADVRTSILESLPADLINKHLKVLTQSERLIALKLLGYPENSIGRLMTPDYVALKTDWTVQQAFDNIRENGQAIGSLDTFFIVDEKGRLVDDITARQLLLSSPAAIIKEIADGKFISLNVADDQEVAIEEFKTHNKSTLPVTDAAGALLGIVTIDDVLQVAEEENTEDIQKLGAVEALDMPYMQTTLATMVQKRSTWLIVLFIGEMLTATAMAHFEHEIARAVVLALFIPLIVSSGGNSGSQAATLIIRALALGEVTLRDWWKIMRREVISGLLLGLILGVIGFLRIAIWQLVNSTYGEHWLILAVTIGITLVGVVMWGTLIGSMFPIILKRFGVDPATASAPFVATAVDVTGLIIYFSVAAILMRGSLL